MPSSITAPSFGTKRDILIVCDSHIFAVNDLLARSAFAERIAYGPVLFYANTMAAIA